MEIQPNRVIVALTWSDFVVWGSDYLITIIFSLYIVTFIPGATPTNVGVSVMLYLLMSGVATIPLGRLMDRHKGFIDESLVLIFATLMKGVLWMLIGLSNSIWSIYLLHSLIGVTRAANLTSWRILFTNNLEQGREGSQWGKYEMIISIGYAIGGILGGVMGDVIGFRSAIILGGGLTSFGALIPLIMLSFRPPTHRRVKKYLSIMPVSGRLK